MGKKSKIDLEKCQIDLEIYLKGEFPSQNDVPHFSTPIVCPTGELYEIIENKCYYFHNNSINISNFHDTKSICKKKLVNGRIYEPKSLSNMQLIRDEYKKKVEKANC